MEKAYHSVLRKVLRWVMCNNGVKDCLVSADGLIIIIFIRHGGSHRQMYTQTDKNKNEAMNESVSMAASTK